MTNEPKPAGFYKLLLVGISGLIAGVGVLALAARRSGRSLRGQFVAGVVLPACDRAAASPNFERGAGMIALSRKRGAARPSPTVRRRYRIEQKTISGGYALTVGRRGLSTDRRILYLHGGAFVFDLQPKHWPILTALADQVDAAVVVPLYPLAPENDWQPAYAMIEALYEALMFDVGAENIVMVGDSAGGCLVLSICQRLRDRRRTPPVALALLSPWVDLTVSHPAQTEIAKRDRILSIERLRLAGSAWAGQRMPNDPIVNPMSGSLRDLPPILIMTGTDDILNSDAHRLATSAKASGTAVHLREYRGMFHLWMTAPIPEAKAALEEIAEFVSNQFERANY